MPGVSRCFNPSIGLTSVPTPCVMLPMPADERFQSLNRAYKRSDSIPGDATLCTRQQFQSLNRAYKRSDGTRCSQSRIECSVSIPQSGLQAFRLQVLAATASIPSCFNPSIGLTSVPTQLLQNLEHSSRTGFNPSIGLTSVPTL